MYPLTIAKVLTNVFLIVVIPHTLKLTNLKNIKKNDIVNVEIDIIAKYIKNLKKINMFSPITKVINEAKKGKIFILVDDENRENEGDLVIPANKVKHKDITFMAKYGRRTYMSGSRLKTS